MSQILKTLTMVVLSFMAVKANSMRMRHVEELSDGSFNQIVMKSPEPWVVILYNESDSHFHRISKEIDEASILLQGKVRMGSIEVGTYPLLASNYHVTANSRPAALTLPAGSNKNGLGYNVHFLPKSMTSGDLVKLAEPYTGAPSELDGEVVQILEDGRRIYPCRGAKAKHHPACMNNLVVKVSKELQEEEKKPGVKKTTNQAFEYKEKNNLNLERHEL